VFSGNTLVGLARDCCHIFRSRKQRKILALQRLDPSLVLGLIPIRDACRSEA